jgi:hypothetical protein
MALSKPISLLIPFSRGWHASEWTSSDDRVRGGKSRSFFDVVPPGPTAYFHGTLDITALGGAGFASQRTKSTNQTWDLSAYDGIQLELGEAIDKEYTLILKDELLPKDRGTGREQSTISYEYDFHVPEHRGGEIVVAIPWGKFAATYRGKPRKDAKALDPKNVKRFSVMIRRYDLLRLLSCDGGIILIILVSLAIKKACLRLPSTRSRLSNCPTMLRKAL